MQAVERPIRTIHRTRGNRLATATNYEQREDRAFSANVRTDDAQRFRTAVRHSRRVRRLRIGIPIGVALVLAGFALSTWLSQLRLLIRLPGEFPGLVIQGTTVTRQAPRISGYTTDGRPYQLNARAAAQDLTDPSKVELQDL